jgi:hypothetical protein
MPVFVECLVVVTGWVRRSSGDDERSRVSGEKESREGKEEGKAFLR